MNRLLFAAAGRSASLDHCIDILAEKGYAFTSCLTDPVTHLLLPIPSVDARIYIKGDGPLQAVLEQLSPTATVIGGNLPTEPLDGRPCIDLLKDEEYVCQNAYITAHCAMALAAERLDTTFRRCACLVIGWGRIGKCLADVMAKLENPAPVNVPGNDPYVELKPSAFHPAADETCVKCGVCAEQCPVGAIPLEAPSETLGDVCINCMRCVQVCPVSSRALPEPFVAGAAQMLSEKAAGYKKPEVFL